MDLLVPGFGVSLILIGILSALPARHRARLWAATKASLAQCAMIICLVSGSAILAYDWLWQTTATAPRPGALWRGQLPGYDLGLDVRPATAREDGSVQLWVYPHDADDYTPLIRLYGAPAWSSAPPAPVVAPPPAPLPTPTKPMKQV